MVFARFEAMFGRMFTMSKLARLMCPNRLLAVLLLSGCSAPAEPYEIGGIGDVDANDAIDANDASDANDANDANDASGEIGEWTAYTSEEHPALSCPAGQVVRGIDCEGSFCDNIALYCAATGLASGATKWLPYFSEEGSGGTDEGRCASDDTWMTGIHCKGGFCDQLSIQCTQMLESSTGACVWSHWHSEEQAPFVAPAGYYLDGIECDGPFCDEKRYHHCEMD
jgi:hypothetical protein